MQKNNINRFCAEIFRNLLFVFILLLTSCASWNEEFEDEVLRGYPHASIHKISKMTDEGIIKEVDNDLVLSREKRRDLKVFKDGNISRGVEDVRRMYMMSYEDASKNLHIAHYLYLVVEPAQWIVI